MEDQSNNTPATPAQQTPQSAPVQTQTPAEPVKEQPKDNQGSSKKFLWVGLIVLLILVVGGIAFVFGTNNAATAPIKALIIKPHPSTPPSYPSAEPTQEVLPSEEPSAAPTEETKPTEAPTQAPTEAPTPTTAQ